MQYFVASALCACIFHAREGPPVVTLPTRSIRLFKLKAQHPQLIPPHAFCCDLPQRFAPYCLMLLLKMILRTSLVAVHHVLLPWPILLQGDIGRWGRAGARVVRDFFASGHDHVVEGAPRTGYMYPGAMFSLCPDLPSQLDTATKATKYRLRPVRHPGDGTSSA